MWCSIAALSRPVQPASTSSPTGISTLRCPPRLSIAAEMMRMPSLPRTGDLHHLGPFFDVGAYVRVELRRRHQHRHRALLRPRLLDIRAREHLLDLFVELVDNGLRRAGRRHHADPDRGLVTGHSSLVD